MDEADLKLLNNLVDVLNNTQERKLDRSAQPANYKIRKHTALRLSSYSSMVFECI